MIARNTEFSDGDSPSRRLPRTIIMSETTQTEAKNMRLSAGGVVGTRSGEFAATIACVGCGTQSPLSSRFCGSCGVRLWEPCLACEQANSVVEKFCGGCGDELATRLVEAKQHVVSAIAQAERDISDGRYLEAMARLNSLKLSDHSNFATYRAEVPKLLEFIAEQRDLAITKMSEAAAQAKALVAERRYPTALEVVATVPVALRSSEMRELFDDLTTKVATAKRLRKEIQQGLADKQYEGMLERAERLSQLGPLDEKLQQLLAQLRQRKAQSEAVTAGQLLTLCEQALAKNDYARAAVALAKVPESTKTNQADARYASLRERVFLAEQLARSPYANAVSVAVATRLAKLQPEDEGLTKLFAQLQAKWKKSLQSPNGQPVSWSRIPESCFIAKHVDIMSVPPGLAELAHKKNWLPQQFITAYGLALQAAGRSKLSIALQPPTKAGWRERLTLKSPKKLGDESWGLDVGSHSIKAVCVSRTSSPDTPAEIRHVLMAPVTRSSTQTKEERGKIDPAAVEAINKMFAEFDLSTSSVVTNLPGIQTLSRFFAMPYPSPAKFAEAVKFEIQARIPLKPEEVVADVDASILGTDDDKQRWVSLVAAQVEHVQTWHKLFEDLRWGSVTLTSSLCALINAMPEELASDKTIAIVGIGAASTGVCVVSPERKWFRSFYRGADDFDGAIAQHLGTDRATAEQLRKKPEKAQWMHRVDEALVPQFTTFVEALGRTLQQCTNETQMVVDRVLLCGGAVETMGLVRFLRLGK